MTQKTYIKNTIIISLILFWIIGGAYLYSQTQKYVSIYSFVVIAYMSILSFISFTLHKKSEKSKDPQDIYNNTLLITTLRLFSGLIILTLYYIIVKENLGIFIFNFFIIYFIYTVFEIKSFMYNLQPHSKKEE